MLTPAPLTSASDASDYYARDNYYTKDDGVENSWWQGAGAEELGLTGEVDPEVFQQILTGRIDEATQLGRKTKEGIRHRPGWDFTFSAPKSLSILSEVYGVEDLRRAHENAVKKALAFGEENLARARLKIGDKVEFVPTKNVIVAAFTHDVSREQEPQIHTHAVHANATLTESGWRSLSPELYFKQQHAFSAVYKRELAAGVKALGFELRPSRYDQSLFEIKGVSDDLIESFSTRARQIRDSLEAQNIEYNSAAAKKASLATRRKKENFARPELRQLWRERAEEFLKAGTGLSPTVAQKVNALQARSDLYIEVPRDVFGQRDTATNFADSTNSAQSAMPRPQVYNTQDQALDSVIDQYEQTRDAVLIAKDEKQRGKLDARIRDKKIKDGQLGKVVAKKETYQPVYLTIPQKKELINYRVGLRLTAGKVSGTIKGIDREEQKIALEGQGGALTTLQLKDVPISAVLEEKKIIEFREGEKIRFTSSDQKIGVLKNTEGTLLSGTGDEILVKSGKTTRTLPASALERAGYNYSKINTARIKKNAVILRYIENTRGLGETLEDVRDLGKNQIIITTPEVQKQIDYLESRQAQIDAVRSVRKAIRHLREREMSSADNELLATAKTFDSKGLTEDILVSAIERQKTKNYLLPAPEHADQPGVPRWTTKKAIEQEERLIKWVDKGKLFDQKIMSEEAARYSLRKTHLNDVQKSAVFNALTTGDQYHAIQGDPGVGKTTTLQELKKYADRARYNVLGFAPSHQAVSELSKSMKIQGYTVDRYLVDTGLQAATQKNKRSLWVVDEAGMLTTPKLNELLERAEQAKAKVLLVGDHQQLESVGPGQGFKLLLESGISHSVIDKRLRQKTDVAKKVTDEVMAKEYRQAFETLSQNGGFIKEKNEDLAIGAMVGEWQKLSPEEREKTIIVTPTNEQRHRVDDQIRPILKAEGQLQTKEKEYTFLEDRYLTEEQKKTAKFYEPNDVVRFNTTYDGVTGLRNSKINRDDYFKVVAIKENDNTIILSSIKHKQMISINPREIGANKNGAATVYREVKRKIAVGDQVRWTDSRSHLGIAKNAEGKVTAIDNEYIRFSVGAKSIKIKTNEFRDRHLVHNYAKTAYNVQGATSERVFALMTHWRRNTVNQRSLMVSLTRASNEMKIFTGSQLDKLSEAVKKRTADNTRAKTFAKKFTF